MATYYVNSSTGSDTNNGSSGAPWKTLGKAKNAISINDTVIITGTFSESTTITKQGTTWRASSPGAAIIDGGWTPLIQYSAQSGRFYISSDPAWGSPGLVATTQWTPLFSIGAADVTLDGLVMRNHAGQGVSVPLAGHRALVKNCKFDLIFNTAINSTGDGAIGVDNQDSLFENNVITRASAKTLVTGWGAKFAGGVSISAIRNVFRNNIISHTWGEGIDIQHQSVDTLVEGNIIYNCMSTHIYVVTSRGTVVRNNLVFHTGDKRYSWSTGSVSEGLQLADEVQSRVNLGNNPSENNQFYNNIVVNLGLCFNLPNGSTKTNNEVKQLYVGHNTFVAGPATRAVIQIGRNIVGVQASESLIENNIFQTIPGAPIYSLPGGASNYVSGIKFRNNLWSVVPDARLQGTGDQIGAPNLANAFAVVNNVGPGDPLPVNSNNYKLTESSTLAIGNASNGSAANSVTPPLAARSMDYFYQGRIAPADIGAHEYSGYAPPPPPPPETPDDIRDMIQTGDGKCNAKATYWGLEPNNIPWAALRFADRWLIPQGSSVQTAYLSGYMYHPSKYNADFDIQGEARDDGVELTPTDNNISTRPLTAASVNWKQGYTGPGMKTSPNIAAIIEEIVNRPGWTPGNYINLIMSTPYNAVGHSRFWGWRSGFADKYPTLTVTFTPPDEEPPVDPPPLPPGTQIPDPDGAIIRYDGARVAHFTSPAISYELPRYVVRAGPNQMLLVTGHYLSNSSLVDYTVTLTYAGQAMTLVTSNKATNSTTGQQFVTGLWKLDNPPAGMGDIVMTADREGISSALLAPVVIKGRRKTNAIRIISPTWTETDADGVYTSSPTLTGCTAGGYLIVANTTSSTDAPMFIYDEANRRYSRNGGSNTAQIAAAGAYRYVIPADGGSVPVVVTRNGGDATKMASIAVEILPNTDNPAVDRYISYGVIS